MAVSNWHASLLKPAAVMRFKTKGFIPGQVGWQRQGGPCEFQASQGDTVRPDSENRSKHTHCYASSLEVLT